MSQSPPTMELPAAIRATDQDSWARLWRHCPSDSRDDALLEWERQSPRWHLIQRRLVDAFGGIEGLETVELGSGRGDLSVMLAQRGAKVTLVDTSCEVLDQARRRFERLGLTASYAQEDLFGSLPSCRDRFDVVVSSGVIEHFKGAKRTQAIRAHYQVLKPGGLAVISVPHAWCIPYRVWKFYLELRGWWPYGMELPYTRSELTRRASRAGFAGIETSCLGFWESIRTHWMKGLLGRDVAWSHRISPLDETMGVMLLLFGRRSQGRAGMFAEAW